MKKYSQGFASIIILIIIVGLLVVAGSYVVENKNLLNKLPKVSVSTPSPSPTASTDPTADWETYTNSKYDFELKYPSSWIIAQKIDLTKIYDEYKIKNFEAVFIDKNNEIPGITSTFPSLQIAIFPKTGNMGSLSLSAWVLKYLEDNIVGSSSVAKVDPLADFDKLSLANFDAIKYYDSVFISKGNNIYFIGFIFQGTPPKGYDRETIFNQILSTFKFTTGAGANYTCPKGGWVNCMPGPGKPNPECASDALNWYKTNCPDFQGVAY